MNKTERTEILLALLLINQNKNASLTEKIELLNIAGFSNLEIANILEISSESVANALYKKRKTKSNKQIQRSK